jgi:membrane protease YdiL (CAAX protease family)
MSAPRAVLAVLAGLGVYVVGALAAARAARRAGQSLSAMEARTSPRVMTIGAVANLVILCVVLVMVPTVLGMPVGVLGFALGGRDVVASLVAFLWFLVLARSPSVTWAWRSPTEGPRGAAGLLAVTALLAVVAAQEEVLFRGYMTASLGTAGPVTIVGVTAVLFATVHLLTNPVSAPQIAAR